MDWQVLSNLSPGVAVGALIAYFYNTTTVKYLDERKEMIEAMAVERREWTTELQRLSDRYDARLIQAVEAIANINNQMHALRGKLTEFMLTGKMPSRGSSGND